MTEGEYYAAIRALGLVQKQFLTTWFDTQGETHSVPLPEDLTPAARKELVDRIKQSLSRTA